VNHPFGDAYMTIQHWDDPQQKWLLHGKFARHIEKIATNYSDLSQGHPKMLV